MAICVFLRKRDEYQKNQHDDVLTLFLQGPRSLRGWGDESSMCRDHVASSLALFEACIVDIIRLAVHLDRPSVDENLDVVSDFAYYIMLLDEASHSLPGSSSDVAHPRRDPSQRDR